MSSQPVVETYDASPDAELGAVVSVCIAGGKGRSLALFVSRDETTFLVQRFDPETNTWPRARYGFAQYFYEEVSGKTGAAGYVEELAKTNECGLCKEHLQFVSSHEEWLKQLALNRSTNRAVRIEAIRLLGPESMVPAILKQRNPHDKTVEDIVASAVAGCENEEFLFTLLGQITHRGELVDQINSPSKIHHLVWNHPSLFIREQAVKKVANQGELKRIHKNHWCPKTAQAALCLIDDVAYVMQQDGALKNPGFVKVVGCIKDNALLEEILGKTRDRNVIHAAVQGMTDVDTLKRVLTEKRPGGESAWKTAADKLPAEEIPSALEMEGLSLRRVAHLIGRISGTVRQIELTEQVARANLNAGGSSSQNTREQILDYLVSPVCEAITSGMTLHKLCKTFDKRREQLTQLNDKKGAQTEEELVDWYVTTMLWSKLKDARSAALRVL